MEERLINLFNNIQLLLQNDQFELAKRYMNEYYKAYKKDLFNNDQATE